MPDQPDSPARPAGEQPTDDRLRALVAAAGSDAPTPPDFETVISAVAGRSTPPTSGHRRLVAGIGAGLAVAAALALFFLVPRGEDDTFAPADTDPMLPSVTTAPESDPVDSRPGGTITERPVATAPAEVPVATDPQTTTSTTVVATSTAVVSTSTTSGPAPVVVIPPPTEPVAAIDLATGNVFDVEVFAPVILEPFVSSVTARLGTPALDTGWRPMPDQASCHGSTAFRTIWWGDLRMTFEQYGADGSAVVELSAWSVGDPSIVGLVPLGGEPQDVSTLVTTLDGIAIGSSRADVIAVADNVFEQDGRRLTVLTSGTASSFQFDEADRVTGFGIGPFDCSTEEDR